MAVRRNLNVSGSSPHARGGRPIRRCRDRGWAAHPRMRGEGISHTLEVPRYGGSSPHARGGPSGRGRRSCCPWAHPRMRGEGSHPAASCASVSGSSPHARGGPGDGAAGGVVGGLIPACAGRARSFGVLTSPCAAHPRMRGEGSGGLDEKVSLEGSSPHARGGPPGAHRSSARSRLIPACAGRAPTTTSGRPKHTAHPRMRGEHGSVDGTDALILGSSPHARGARSHPPSRSTAWRLIPACAGSTPRRQRSPSGPAAHPRMRGEHAATAAHHYGQPGSSPHARGARAGPRRVVLRGGLIPACAGSTRGVGRTCTGPAAHPRMRGEHTCE